LSFLDSTEIRLLLQKRCTEATLLFQLNQILISPILNLQCQLNKNNQLKLKEKFRYKSELRSRSV